MRALPSGHTNGVGSVESGSFVTNNVKVTRFEGDARCRSSKDETGEGDSQESDALGQLHVDGCRVRVKIEER